MPDATAEKWAAGFLRVMTLERLLYRLAQQ